MCIHHFNTYTCGCIVKNTPLSLLTHCRAVDSALRYYHDQSLYNLADARLFTAYGRPTWSQLPCPSTCPIRFPPLNLHLPILDPTTIPAYNEWQYSVLEYCRIHYYDLSSPNNHYWPSQKLQYNLDNASEALRKQHAEAYKIGVSLDDHKPLVKGYQHTHAPYPEPQLAFLADITFYQESGQYPHAWNSIFHPLPYGCGRKSEAACMVGHGSGPQCPFLLASRGVGAEEWACLADLDPQVRGGAVNDCTASGKWEHVRSALVYEQGVDGQEGGGEGGEARRNGVRMVRLEEEVLSKVFGKRRPPPGTDGRFVGTGWYSGKRGAPVWEGEWGFVRKGRRAGKSRD